MARESVGNDFNETYNDNAKRFFIGLTLNGDSDLLHLSEGISNDLILLFR